MRVCVVTTIVMRKVKTVAIAQQIVGAVMDYVFRMRGAVGVDTVVTANVLCMGSSHALMRKMKTVTTALQIVDAVVDLHVFRMREAVGCVGALMELWFWMEEAM